MRPTKHCKQRSLVPAYLFVPLNDMTAVAFTAVLNLKLGLDANTAVKKADWWWLLRTMLYTAQNPEKRNMTEWHIKVLSVTPELSNSRKKRWWEQIANRWLQFQLSVKQVI